MILPRPLARLLRPGPAGESRQGLWRIGLALVVAPMLAIAAALIPASPDLDRAAAFAIGGLLYATAWFAVLGERDSASPGRRIAAMLCDYTLIAALLAVGGAWTAPLYLLLIAATLDHGLRFGVRSLPFAAVGAIAAMLCVVAISPWWGAVWPLGLALAALPALLPVALHPLRAALLQAQRQARHVGEARHRVLQELDHEFRAPLDAIVGVSKTLFATRVTPEQREGGELVQSAAQSLLRRIGDTLDLAAAEAGTLAPQSVDFNLRDGVARVRNAVQPLASARGVALQVDVDAALPVRLRGDARRLWQVLARLLQDAVDRTDDGSVLATLRRRAGEGEAFGLRLDVRDTGFDDDQARRRRREAMHSGAQPDLVSAIATLLGGRSGIEPNPGGGVHAYVDLPFAAAPSLPESEYAGEAKVVAFDDPLVRHRARVRPLRVLLADEPCANRLVLQRLLQRAGHEVVLADDGEQALERIERGEVDAGLAHARLSGLGGLDVLRYARMLHNGARVLPLALVSADSSPALVREAEAAGAFAFLPTPVQVPRLLEVLAEMSEAIRAPLAAPVTPADNASAIGLDVVQELIALNLGEGFVAGFVEQCLRDAGQCMTDMERCGLASDWDGMREAAHALKGLGQNFAARAVAEACDAMVRSGDLVLRNDWRRRVAQLDGLLQACWKQVRAEMERLALRPRPVDLDPGTEKR